MMVYPDIQKLTGKSKSLLGKFKPPALAGGEYYEYSYYNELFTISQNLS